MVISVLCTSCLGINGEPEEEKITVLSNNTVEETMTDKNNDNIIINKFNISAINDNDNQIATDGKYIYYIDSNNNYIYKVNLDGTNNEIISEHKSSKLIYYKEKLYFNEYNQGIACIDKDGSNYQILFNEKPINNFLIYEGAIYMKVLTEEKDEGYMFSFYKYNLIDGKVDVFDDSITTVDQLGLCLINDKVYYNVDGKTREYDTESNTIKNYDIFVYDLQEFNNYIYSHYDKSIIRCEINNISEFSKIYEIDDDYRIKRISVIDDLIFFTYAYDYTEIDEKNIFVDVINIDGSNQRNIFKFEYSTLGHYAFDQIYALNNNLLVMSSDSEYPLFKVFDFEGNELWSLY